MFLNGRKSHDYLDILSIIVLLGLMPLILLRLKEYKNEGAE